MIFPGVAFEKRISGRYFLLFLFFPLYTILFYESAWLSDDSFITFRVVDNFLNGFGLRWNPLERVQVYTHPLWLFLLVPIQALIGEISISAYLLSYVCGILFLFTFVFSFYRNGVIPGMIPASLLLLFCSRIFVDYNTSGLENPLSFLLVFLFFDRFYSVCSVTEGRISKREGLWLGLLTASLLLTRLDLALLLIAPLSILFFRMERTMRMVFSFYFVLGLLPWLGFLFFSLIYYGSIFPNTFYAKTNVISPLSERINAGWNYIRISLQWDPIACFVFLFHFFLIVSERIFGKFNKVEWVFSKEERGILWLGMGAIVPVFLYLLLIGGDFMSGRFFGTCLIVSIYSQMIFLLKRFGNDSKRIRKGFYSFCVVVACYFLAHPASPFRYFFQRQEVRVEKGVVDERASYQDNVSLKSWLKGVFPESHPWAVYAIKLRFEHPRNETKESLKERFQKIQIENESDKRSIVARNVEITTNVGLAGYYGGPEIHWIDLLGITDPFLARLPGRGFPGHYIRLLPEGYKEYIQETVSALESPELDRFYYEIRMLSEEEIWTRERWKIIFDFSLFGRGNFKKRFPEGFRYPFVLEAYRRTLYGIPFANWKVEDVEVELNRKYFGGKKSTP